MKTLEKIKHILTSNRKILESQYKVKTMGVFGSFAKGRHKKKSDIDILVEFKETVDFFEFLDLEEYLEDLLGTKIDLVTKKALKPIIKDKILNEVVYV